MTLLEEVLTCPQCIISVMGDHAGESVDQIFHRKATDIERTAKTFWLMKSPKARPVQVQVLCKKIPAYTIFIEPATRGGARPTTREDAAREYSEDGQVWHRIPEGISPVTGKIDNSATALVFDMMTTAVNGTLDLWDYGGFSDTQKPLKFILGCSTVCNPNGYDTTSRKNEVALSRNCRSSATCGTLLCVASINREAVIGSNRWERAPASGSILR
jgi:hypothetical protein